MCCWFRICQELLQKLLEKTDDALKPRIIQEAATYEHRMQLGSKPIFHLEGFVAKYMALYREYQEEAAAMFDWANFTLIIYIYKTRKYNFIPCIIFINDLSTPSVISLLYYRNIYKIAHSAFDTIHVVVFFIAFIKYIYRFVFLKKPSILEPTSERYCLLSYLSRILWSP